MQEYRNLFREKETGSFSFQANGGKDNYEFSDLYAADPAGIQYFRGVLQSR